MRFDLQNVFLKELASKDHHSNPKHLASLMKIAATLVGTRDLEEDFAVKLAIQLIPLAASSKVIIRHEAQWQIPILMDHAKNRGWVSISANPALVALDDYLRSMPKYSDPPLQRQYSKFDPEHDHTLTNLVEGSWHYLDPAESPRTSRKEFLKLYAADAQDNELSSALSPSCMALGSELSASVSELHSSNGQISTRADETKTARPETREETIALQTKGTAYLTRALSSPTEELSRNNNIIVIGSLVDNPYNLGGLSRVSEIFGASALCLQNQNVLSNKDFTSVAVSSHLHFPIVQLSVSGVPDYLVEKKLEGHTVVGIEQTDRSAVLGSDAAQLPDKVVLIVGNEKEGIPALILTQCDVLVEIPQSGITRSLNVQTAVSIVLYEYARQHRQK
jgi:tRNA guanosine-2'-O-methyltransferase